MNVWSVILPRPIFFVLPCALLICLTSGRAEPVQLVVEGQCPTYAELRSSLERSGVVIANTANFALVIRSDGERATLSTQNRSSPNGGQELLVRQVKSNDCSAVAELFVLIAIDIVSELAPEVTTNPSDVNPADAATQRTEPAKADLAGIGRADQEGKTETSSARIGKANQEPILTTEPAENNAKPQEGMVLTTSANQNNSSPKQSNITLGLASGLALIGNTDTIPAVLQVDGLTNLSRYKIRAHAWTETPSLLRSGLKQHRYGLGLEMGVEQSHRALWLRTMVGASVVVSQITSQAINGNTILRLHPAITSTASIGWEFHPGLALRTEARGFWLPIHDRYFNATGTSVGESPRAVISMGIGLEWRLR